MSALSRRTVLAAPAALLMLSGAAPAENEFLALERTHGGRLGVAALNTGMGKRIAHRANERFAMCSTFKLLMTAAVLKRVDEKREQLDRLISYSKKDLVTYSPMTEKDAGEGHMTVGALCEAVITLSDNTAANLLLGSLGGPGAVTRFARTLGDRVTRLDRIEPALNFVPPGDERDTTTPSAMLGDLRAILTGDVLSNASQGRLIGWLKACQTGNERLRAGFAAGWVVGDKTGSGPTNETNDLAIVWPPGRPPILVAAYYAGSKASDDKRNAVLAEVGRIVARRFA